MKLALSLKPLKHSLHWTRYKSLKRPGIRKGGGLPPFGGSGDEDALNTAFEEPKLTLFWFYKLPKIWAVSTTRTV